VYGSDGDKVGDVAEVGRNYVLVQKGWLFTKDIYIPVSAISSADEDGVYLNIPKDQINSMDWDMAPMEDATTTTYGSTYDTTTTSTTGMRDTSATTVTNTDYAAPSDVVDTRSSLDSPVVDTRSSVAGTGTRNVDAREEARIPVVEEELRVGKREVDSGGVRVTTRVEEVPVNEQVTVREEHVSVDRRPVDRAATDADFAAAQQGALEVREHREEVVVDKQARIVEEVVINKEVAARTETIQDTVRSTDVDVQEIRGETRTSDYVETGRTRTGDVAGTGTTYTTRSGDVAGTGQNEGAIERGLSKAGNAAERATGRDLDRDGDVGRRDPRNNI
jgi:uncharacterized protein (TIGR02271 family)